MVYLPYFRQLTSGFGIHLVNSKNDSFEPFKDWLVNGFARAWPHFLEEEKPLTPAQKKIVSANAKLLLNEDAWKKRVNAFESALEKLNNDEAREKKRALYEIRFDEFEFNRSDFIDRVFPCLASFRKAKFIQEANFSGVKFLEIADYRDAIFSKEAYFSKTEFTKFAYFNNIEFSGETNFFRAKFSKRAGFNGARFLELTSFSMRISQRQLISATPIFLKWPTLLVQNFRACPSLSAQKSEKISNF